MDGYDAQMPAGATTFPPIRAEERVATFLRAVYGWMTVGLGLTAAVAWGVAGSPALVAALQGNPLLLFGIVAAELGLVFYLSARVDRLGPGQASGLFLLYAGLNGVTLALVLLVFTGASVASTFLVCAGMFGALAAWGTTTRRNLAGVGPFMFMGLVGLVLASIVGLFWQSDALQFVIACAGVVVFTGLTAYDAQRLREMALQVPPGTTGAAAVVGALALYLDFVNLFLMLLRFLGERRE